METTAKVLETMRSAGKPVSAGEVATLSGLDRKEVDKAFAQLKKDGAIVSPVRCKWQPAEYDRIYRRQERRSLVVSSSVIIILDELLVKLEFSGRDNNPALPKQHRC